MNRKGTHSPLRSQSGSSLIYVLMGMSIMSAVGFSAAHVAADARKSEFMGDITNSVSQVHLISIQQSRNITLLRGALASAGVNLTPGTNTSKCFSGAGNNNPAAPFDCRTLSTNGYVSIPVWSEPVRAVIGQLIQNNISFRVVCSTVTTCEMLHVRVATGLADGSVRRNTDLRISGTLLGELPELSFACVSPSDSFITGIDFARRRANCAGIGVATTCSNGRPLADLDANSNATCRNLATTATDTCTQGFKSLGLISDQGTCL